MEKKNICLKMGIIKNKNISSEGVMVYAGLVIASKNEINRLYTTIGAIQLTLKMQFEDNRYFKNKIKRGLINLKNNNVINIHSEKEDFKNNDAIVIELNNFKIDDNNDSFITVSVDEINRIISYYEDKFEHEKLLRYFFLIIDSINKDTKIGCKSIDSLSEASGVHVTTSTIKYNPILENLKLIYICRNCRMTSNVYGKYEYKDTIEKSFVINCVDNDKIIDTKLTNKIRSSLSWWRNYSIRIFKNRCLLSNIEGDIAVHHQKQLNTIIKEVLEEMGIENENSLGDEIITEIKKKVNEKHKLLPIGICLNKDIHLLFHMKYGKKECEKCDFDEFIERYFNGEFDNELAYELRSINSKRSLEEVKKMLYRQ